MQRKKYVSIICAGAALLLAGCGSSSTSNNNQNPVTGLKKRALVSNQVAGTVTIMDAQKDTRAKVLGVPGPSKMVTAGGFTAILPTGANQISFIDNTKEEVLVAGILQGPPVDIAISTDGKIAYAAVRTVGVVEPVVTASGNVINAIPIPSVTRLVEGPKEHKLLAFADDPQALGGSLKNAFFVIDTATNTAAPVTDPSGTFLDQPYTAVFDPSDTNDTTAFILNCGPECGGIAASVTKVNFSNPAAPVFTGVAPISVAGATVGLLSGSSLFVAGTPAVSPAGCTLSRCGSLQVINTGSLTAGTAIPITDGLHSKMALTSNNHLYIGAGSCTPGVVVANQVRGCLSIFNTGGAVSSSNPTFPVESSLRIDLNVTGLLPISGRNVIYVLQGGELDIFDFTTDTLTTNQLDFVGNAIDAVQIDP
jgi:hypothetical protein